MSYPLQKLAAQALLPALVLAAAPATAQIDQVYDVRPPVYEEDELESVANDTNEGVWPGRIFSITGDADFDDTAGQDEDFTSDDASRFTGTTMLYENQPIPDIYRQDLNFDTGDVDSQE